MRGPFSKRKQVQASRNARGPFLLRGIDFVIKSVRWDLFLVSGGGGKFVNKIGSGTSFKGTLFHVTGSFTNHTGSRVTLHL